MRAVTHNLHDQMLSELIVSARRYVENDCGISLVTQTREIRYDWSSMQGSLLPGSGFYYATGPVPQVSGAAFAQVYLPLDFGPVQSIMSFTYRDSAGVATEYIDYQF